MSDAAGDGHDTTPRKEPFGGAPREDASETGGLPMAGGTALPERVASIMREQHVANPDDPLVGRPLYAASPTVPGPSRASLPGRIAIVQGQVYIAGLVLIAQLVMVTLALYELLSGRPDTLWGIAAASLAGFILAVVVALWPRTK